VSSGDSIAATPVTGPAPPESIRKNALFALAARILTGLFTALVTLFLVRALGPDDFGVLALALGLAGLARLVADFGIPSSAARFLAEAPSDPHACAAVLRDALRLTLAVASAVAVALFLASGAIADAYDNADLVWPLRCLAISLLAESVLALYLSAFTAVARVRLTVRIVFFESLAEAAATVALVLAGGAAVGAALGRTVGYCVGAAVAVVIVLRVYGRVSVSLRQHGARTTRRTREIFRYAVPLFVMNGLYGLYARIDVLLIGAILGTTAVGQFSAPLSLTTPLANFGVAAASGVSPRQGAIDPGERRVDAFVAALRWLMIVQAILIAPLLVWAEPIVNLLFGSDFEDSIDVLRALVPFVFLISISPLISSTAVFLGRARSRSEEHTSELVANIVIDVTLLPEIGVVAAGIGTSVAYILYVPGNLRICRQELGFPLRPLSITVLRVLAAAAAMGAVLYVVGGTTALSLWQATLAVVLGLAAYGAILTLTGEVTRRELRYAWRWLSAAAVRARRRR